MANNIKIVGNITETLPVNRYSPEDIALIASKQLKEDFGAKEDYIEYFVFDAGNNLLNTNYNYLSYKLPKDNNLKPGVEIVPNTKNEIQTTGVGIESSLTSTGSKFPIIEIDPVIDLQNLGYSSGEFVVKYNFFQNKISDSSERGLFIKEISKDRTEIRLGSVVLSDSTIESGSLALIDKVNETDEYFVDYLLNVGDNNQYVVINVALNKEPGGYEVLLKLYKPLPISVQLKQTAWIVEEQSTPYSFDINLDRLIVPAPPPTLRGPNFGIPLDNQGTIPTAYTNYFNLLKNLQNSSYNKIQNILTSQSIDINVDYTDFNNFVFFGSAYQRVNNFYNKVRKIEETQNWINTYLPFVATTSSLQLSINEKSSSISTIISEFDGYESYLYFESNSYAYPKVNPSKPFILQSTSSAQVISWYNDTVGIAQEYDASNYDNLEYAVPVYLLDNTENQPFWTFLNMVGHYFDNIWVYVKSITDINLANNNLDYGISRDLVYHRLRSLGIKLYNSQAGDSIANYLVGANTGSSTWDNDFTITGSYLNNIPRKDLVAELHKRIYHNLPLLTKTKGTVNGLNYLLTLFGIPNRDYYTIYSGSNYETYYTPTGSLVSSSILNVKEFGGSLKANYIRGYNNDKARILPNNIFGNVLSPLLSFQQYPTASTEFRDDDLHYVDISFSPQTQIDTYISGAIMATDPLWVIDDYIGDPSHLYSGSYPDLDTQRTLYYQTGVPGFLPFTASLLDYNGFIRLIEFFDNSLFKMLNDFVPERTSLSTGVTITSPILERNKVVHDVPSATTHSILVGYDSLYGINSQYGYFYNTLANTNDTDAWYTGDISGSLVDVHQYYLDDPNPYDGDWTSYNGQNPPTKRINIETFIRSDYNAIINNVSASITSSLRKKLEPTGDLRPINYLTSSVELQDSYLYLRSYNNSRYDGIKLISKEYNEYTSASYTGSDGFTIQLGDKSYGKTAAIDRQSYKVAWVKNIPSQSLNFVDKTQIQLKYLVDSATNITDLTLKNNNLFEVQNMFKSGETVVLSLSDAIKPSFQKKLDGVKNIFRGGFSFDPIFFREQLEPLIFLPDATQIEPKYQGFKLYDINFHTYWPYFTHKYSMWQMANVYNSQTTLGTTSNISANTAFLTYPSANPQATINSTTIIGYNHIFNNTVSSTKPIANPPSYEQNTINSIATQRNWPNELKMASSLFGTNITYMLSSSRSNGRKTPGTLEDNTDYSGSQLWNKYDRTAFQITNQVRRAYELIGDVTAGSQGAFQFNTPTSSVLGTSALTGYLDYKDKTLADLTQTGGQLYSFVSPQSAQYIVRSKVPFLMEIAYFEKLQGDYISGSTQVNYGLHPYEKSGSSFQIIGVLEKQPANSNQSTTWEYVAHTKFQDFFVTPSSTVTVGGQSSVDGYVKFGEGRGKGDYRGLNNQANPSDDLQGFGVNLELWNFIDDTPDISVYLEQGDKLRYRLFLYDLDGFFSYGAYAKFEVGKANVVASPGTTFTQIGNLSLTDSNFQSLSYPFFEVFDEDNPSSEIPPPITITTPSLFTSNGTDTISFTTDIANLILNTPSTFQPTGSSSLLYSPVIDSMSIQPFDLVRIGSINNPKSQYYTVIETISGSIVDTNVSASLLATLNGTSIDIPVEGDIYAFSKSYLDEIWLNTDKKFYIVNNYAGINPSTLFEITSRSPLNILIGGISKRVIRYTVTPSTGVTINFFNSPLPGTNYVVFNGTEVPVLPNQSSPATLRVKLDRKPFLRNTVSNNFAFLRPKPDETSVIIDFKKTPGDVSQTILLPQDSSEEIKKNVGAIFQKLNVDLSNQNQSTTTTE